jgi:hypothetical protein
MVYFFSSFICKISFEASDTAAIMKSKSLTVRKFYIFGLTTLDFFYDVSFIGETFLFLDISASSREFLGSVTSPCFCLSSSPYFSSLSTSSSPPPLSESDVVSSDVFCISYTYSFFFFLLLLGASYS